MTEPSHAAPEFPPRMTVCVGAVVLRGERVLFVRQTYGESLTGVYTVPWGFVQGMTLDGQLDPPHSAALRETLEEGGMTAETEGLLGIQTHQDVAGQPRLYTLFLCRHVSGEPRPDGVETDRAAYFTMAELEALSEPVDAICLWLAQRVLRREHHVIPFEPDNPYKPHGAIF